MDLLLVRHGLPERVEGAEGPADPVLTPTGLDQAERLADWLAHERIDQLMSSTLRRAQQTAAPVGERMGLDVELVQGLSEFDADADSYIPIEELRQTRDPRFFALVEGRWDELGSTVDPTSFADLVHTTIEGVVGRFPGQRVAVVCHGGVINLYPGRGLGLGRTLWVEPGHNSIRPVAGSQGGHPTLGTLHETDHPIATRARCS